MMLPRRAAVAAVASHQPAVATSTIGSRGLHSRGVCGGGQLASMEGSAGV
jgi:hypothetical protein